MRTSDIDALARLLDEGPTENGEAPEEVQRLGALAQAMETRATAPRPEFRDSLRDILLAEAVKPVPPTLLERARRAVDDQLARVRYSARAAAATGVAAMTLSTGGVAAATTLAVPGDLFYPVKMAVEDARLDRADDAIARSELLLAFTDGRMAEAERAVDSGRHDSAAEALVAADGALREAAGNLIRAYQTSGDRAVLRPLEELDSTSAPRREALRLAAQGPAAGALADLEVTFDRITQRIAAITGECCPAAGSAQPGTPQPGDGFDFSYIPPAGEPFEGCPCPATDEQAPADVTPAQDQTEPPATEPTTPPATEPPAEPAESVEDPPAPADPPAEDSPPLPLPEEVEDAIDSVVDPVEEIIEQVIEPLPVPDPPQSRLDESPLGPLLDEDPLGPLLDEGNGLPLP
jgi:hypothetical protein